jgi:stage II sporulation protein D (peptidoglycan lytic transglycosylase)
MKASRWVTSLGLILWGTGPLPAQRLRVELFSGRIVNNLRISAGDRSTRLCPANSKAACLEVKPGEAWQCFSQGPSVRCHGPSGKRNFPIALVLSQSPFRLTVSLSRRGHAETAGASELTSVQISAARPGLELIATVDLEAYVGWVLAGEASVLKSPEALRAMAVVARTWALRWRGRHRSGSFDFCSLTHCQVFRPSLEGGAEATALNKVVQATAGKIIKFRGDLIDPYFSASCGGFSEDAGEVWPDRAQPYLSSRPDPYCTSGEHFAWQQRMLVQAVTAILRADFGGAPDFALRDLLIADRDSSGRARILEAAGNTALRVDANQFRYAVDRRLGWNVLKSNLYSVERRGDEFFFSGRGLGHGVGLCQAGAEQMGRAGITYDRILANYFPGTSLVSLTPARADPVLSSEHFRLSFPDSQQPWADRALRLLEVLRREISRSTVGLPPGVEVRTWATTAEFVRATGQPGWVAASSDEESIELQPLRLLEQKNILEPTLRHELNHLLVRGLRGRGIPQWFEEGFVLYLSREQIPRTHGFTGGSRTLEEAIERPRSEWEMFAAYARALELVRQLRAARGEKALWQVLEKPGAGDNSWLTLHAASRLASQMGD